MLQDKLYASRQDKLYIFKTSRSMLQEDNLAYVVFLHLTPHPSLVEILLPVLWTASWPLNGLRIFHCIQNIQVLGTAASARFSTADPRLPISERFSLIRRPSGKLRPPPCILLEAMLIDSRRCCRTCSGTLPPLTQTPHPKPLTHLHPIPKPRTHLNLQTAHHLAFPQAFLRTSSPFHQGSVSANCEKATSPFRRRALNPTPHRVQG